MKTCFSLVAILISFTLFSQDNRYGKVSKEELTKERSTIDAESPAEILYEKMEVKLEYSDTERKFIVNKEVEGRIKIYNKDNVNSDLLNVEVVMWAPNSTREKVLGLKGTTYNLVGGKIEETKIKNNEIFTERINKNFERQKFAFSNVKDGSVLEYKYTIVSPYYREIDRWFFQSEVPVVYSSFRFTHPDFFMYSHDLRGETRGKIINDSRPVPNMKFSNKITEYIYQNVKPLRKESFVLNPDNLKSSIRYELMMFNFPGYITENYSATWAQIGKDLNDHENLGKQLSGNNFLDETVQSIISNATNPTEKMHAIFDHVKNNYSWNNFRSIYTDNGIRSTFKDKTGNAADLNLLLVSMLRKAGISADPVVLSTVDNLIINYSFPSVTSLNFVIAGAEINGNLYLMDATEKLSKINMLPLRDLNHRGFLISSNGGIKEIPLTNYSVSSTKEVIGATLNLDGSISGNYSETKDEYFAMYDKMWKQSDVKEFEKDYLSEFDFDVDNFKMDEASDKGLVRYTFKFENIPSADVMGNKILLNPMLFTQLSKPSFNFETRNYPLEFGTAMTKTKTIKIKIPEGYKVESMPQEKQFIVEGNQAGYIYKVEEKDGIIIVNTVYQVGQSILPSTYYKPMKEFEKQQISAEAQQVVLIKS